MKILRIQYWLACNTILITLHIWISCCVFKQSHDLGGLNHTVRYSTLNSQNSSYFNTNILKSSGMNVNCYMQAIFRSFLVSLHPIITKTGCGDFLTGFIRNISNIHANIIIRTEIVFIIVLSWRKLPNFLSSFSSQ